MGKKYFTSEATEKKIIYKIYKQLMQLNIKKKKKKLNQNIGARPK